MNLRSTLPFLALLLAHATSSRADPVIATASDCPVVEMASFHLKPGATTAQLLAASPSVDRFLATCPGFISRILVAGKDGLYTDMVVWSSQSAADAALKKHEREPEACNDYMCLMREEDGAMQHLPVLHASPALR